MQLETGMHLFFWAGKAGSGKNATDIFIIGVKKVCTGTKENKIICS